MEDDLHFWANVRQPHFFGKWKMTSIIVNRRRLQIFKTGNTKQNQHQEKQSYIAPARTELGTAQPQLVYFWCYNHDP